MAPIYLSNSPGAISVKVQPLVLLNICDMYIRRNKDQQRVIGTLLGYVADGVVHVQNSYAVPHNENNDQVSLDISHHKTLFDLYHKVNSKEHVVGWYATSSGLSGADALIHDLYAGECASLGIHAVYLTVDTAMEMGDMAIKAYVARKVALADRVLARKFQEVEVEIQTAEVEAIGADLMKKEVSEKLPADLDGLQTTLKRLEAALERAHAYVDDVVTGKRPADLSMGRYLADSVTGIPRFSAEEFENMLADSAQDSLLVMYLANLVRAHIALADRLGTASLPLLF